MQDVQLALPDARPAWTIQVVTTGGFLGNGVGNYAASSEGKIVCYPESLCSKGFQVLEFQPLIEAIRAKLTSTSPVLSLDPCHDCIITVMTITHRDAAGVVQTFTARWNDVGRHRIPPEILRVHDAFAAALRR